MSASTQKKKHIKAVRPKLRAKEPLLGVFMWGINYSVSLFTFTVVPVSSLYRVSLVCVHSVYITIPIMHQ